MTLALIIHYRLLALHSDVKHKLCVRLEPSHVLLINHVSPGTVTVQKGKMVYLISHCRIRMTFQKHGNTERNLLPMT